MVYDFHTHTFLSDGVLSPVELARRALASGYAALAITDHAGLGGLGPLLERLAEDCALVQEHWGIVALPGVELTHVPAAAIHRAARAARRAGAAIVVVHGETVVEPVEAGTNRAALSCEDVDILAHPGLITLEEARMAAQNGVFLELTARRGHCLTNGHVARIAREAGARLIVNSDHHELDLLTPERARNVALGAGLTEDDLGQVLVDSPRSLLDRAATRWTLPVAKPG
ncbi:MAG TPA: histidinol phosphate phosphatase domain-containing protein [Dehalococcoidia bacterium]|nr:histidinol phosphate phosphatase domain-containing protein [Dehalococcoidia bacterium]